MVNTIGAHLRSLGALPADSPEAEKIRAEATASFRFMEERDPDNGWPLVMLGYIEAGRGAHYTTPKKKRDEKRIAVTNTENITAAARLLHEAAGKKRMTQYGAESLNREFSILGQPETLDEWLVTQYYGISLSPIYNLYAARAVIEFVGDGVEHVIAPGAPVNAEQRETAYQAFHDMQTIGALMMAESTSRINLAIGFACLMIGTEKGVAALNGAGMTAEADRLLARSVALARPQLVYRMSRSDHGYDIWRDYGDLQAEVKRVPATPTWLKDVDKMSVGEIFSLSLPSITRATPAQTEFFTLENIRLMADLEYWAWEKAFSNQLSMLALLVLAVFVIVDRIVSLVGARREPSAVWPTSARMVAAMLIFAATAIVPGLAVARIGHGLNGSDRDQILWLAFWNIWGFVAGAAFLWLNACSSTPGGVGAAFRFRPKNVGEWLFFAVLAASVPAACVAFLAADEGWAAWIVTAALLLPVPLWSLLRLVLRAAFGLRPPFAVRLALAGWAGGLLLWFAAYFPIEGHERNLGRREVLVIPREIGGQFYDGAPADIWDVVEDRTFVRAALVRENKVDARTDE